jgi:hypothetical protein
MVVFSFIFFIHLFTYFLYCRLSTYSILCVSSNANHKSHLVVKLFVLPWQIIGRLLVFSFFMFLELVFILPCLFLILVQRPREGSNPRQGYVKRETRYENGTGKRKRKRKETRKGEGIILIMNKTD